MYTAQAVKNRVILVTGATEGLGKQVALDNWGAMDAQLALLQ